MIKLDPQPDIQGSLVKDGDKVHYSSTPDIDRLFGPVPTWKTLVNPFGPDGDLCLVDNAWHWVPAKGPRQLKLKIPAVVSEDGRVNVAYFRSDQGEESQDVGILWDEIPEGVKARLVHVEATIDLNALFADSVVQSTVTPTESKTP